MFKCRCLQQSMQVASSQTSPKAWLSSHNVLQAHRIQPAICCYQPCKFIPRIKLIKSETMYLTPLVKTSTWPPSHFFWVINTAAVTSCAVSFAIWILLNIVQNILTILSPFRIFWPSLTPVYQAVGQYLQPMKLTFPTTIILITARAIASAK